MTSSVASNASVVLRAWELTRSVAVWQRPAALLSALSSVPLAETLRLGVARRDAALLSWRIALFGADWKAFAQCPACDTMLEYDVPELRSPEGNFEEEDELEVEFMGRSWNARWPNSRDIHEASLTPDRQTAREMLLRRMLPANADPEPAAAAAILAAVAKAHRSLLTLDLHCCACPQTWTVAFDPGEFLWRELRAAARRTLRDIDLIARVYHWSEDQILALSDARRREYLQMVQ